MHVQLKVVFLQINDILEMMELVIWNHILVQVRIFYNYIIQIYSYELFEIIFYKDNGYMKVGCWRLLQLFFMVASAGNQILIQEIILNYFHNDKCGYQFIRKNNISNCQFIPQDGQFILQSSEIQIKHYRQHLISLAIHIISGSLLHPKL